MLTLHIPQIAKEPSKQFRRKMVFSRGKFLAISTEEVICEVELNSLTRRGWSQACRSRRSISNMFTQFCLTVPAFAYSCQEQQQRSRSYKITNILVYKIAYNSIVNILQIGPVNQPQVCSRNLAPPWRNQPFSILWFSEEGQ